MTTGSKPVKKGRANKVPKGGSFISELNKINDNQNNIASIDFFRLNICGDRILPVNGLLHKIFAPQLKQIKREERKLKMTSSGNESGKNRSKEFFLYRDSVEEEKFSNLQGTVFLLLFSEKLLSYAFCVNWDDVSVHHIIHRSGFFLI